MEVHKQWAEAQIMELESATQRCKDCEHLKGFLRDIQSKEVNRHVCSFWLKRRRISDAICQYFLEKGGERK